MAGTATLNWSVDIPISYWEGVLLAGLPLRVTELLLEWEELPSGTRRGRVIPLGNQLTGEIPPELGSLANLGWLDLSDNQLGGEIPSGLDSLANLGWLDLSDNQLGGEIPSGLDSLTNLGRLDLSGNELTGEIPTELGRLANLWRLYLSDNRLSGEIPMELGRLTNLQELDLSFNQLSGEIPFQLADLASLEVLALKGNQLLTGCIPERLRDVASNDLEDLGLPFCDVLLSGLAISPGTLAPPFDSYHTDYTTVVGQSRVTVTPANDHNASFQFLDRNYAVLADADGSLVGHQVDLGAGVTTVRIRVISPDSRATHTYTIVDRTEEIPLCTPIQGSSVDPCEPDVAQVSSNNALVDVGPEPWSVRSFLDGGRGSLFEGHLVVRGTYIPGTVRCIADNTARYPSYLGVPNNSVPEGVSQFKCYADVRVNAYVVGSGPSTLTVLVRAFGYWSNATPEAIERLRSYYERVFIEGGGIYTK